MVALAVHRPSMEREKKRLPVRIHEKRKEFKQMKKTLAMLLALVMIVGLCACSTPAPATTGSTNPPETTAPVEQTPVEDVISVTEENTYTKPLGNVPEVPYWFPADLLAWEPGSDPDDAYNYATEKRNFQKFVTDTTMLPKMDSAPPAVASDSAA